MSVWYDNRPQHVFHITTIWYFESYLSRWSTPHVCTVSNLLYVQYLMKCWFGVLNCSNFQIVRCVLAVFGHFPPDISPPAFSPALGSSRKPRRSVITTTAFPPRTFPPG